MQQPKPLELIANQRIVEEDGTATQYFRDFIGSITRYLPIVGDGTPEGVIEAQLYTPYIDRSAEEGDVVEYRKLRPDVGGDRSKGWVRV